MVTIWARAHLRYASGSLLKEEVVQFLSDNGYHFVNIFRDLSSMKEYVSFKPHNIFFSVNSFEMAKKSIANCKFSIFIYETKKENMKMLLEGIQQTKVMKSLIIFDEPLEDIKALRKQMMVMGLNTQFYMVVPRREDREKLSWFQMISLSSGSVVEEIKFYPGSFLVYQDFNLNGLSVTSITLSWAPFFTIDNCDKKHFKCATGYGYLGDYMDMLARRYNFTYISYKDQNDDWGTVPKEGPFNLSGTLHQLSLGFYSVFTI